MESLMVAAGLAALAAAGSQGARGEWPLPAHDNRLSARAEVPCRMPQAPREIWSYALGQVPCRWAMLADVDGDGRDEVLHGSAPLVCTDLSGKERWRAAAGGVVAIADMDGDGAAEVVCDGPRILSGKEGKTLWTRTGPGDVGRYRIHVGKLIPGVRGLQIACVSEKYEWNYAQVWSFAGGCEHARLVWEREFNKGPAYAHCTSAAGRFDRERMCVAAAVHGGIVAMDTRDGSDLFRAYWEPKKGEGIVRNYGSLAIRDLDGDGVSEFVILNDLIAVQIGALSPTRPRAGDFADQNRPVPSPDVAPGELATYADGPVLWRRYFGDWFPQGETTLHVAPDSLSDVDGDGRLEVVVSVHRREWVLKVYDALTGAEKLSVPGLYLHAVLDLDGDGVSEVVAAREGSRTPREFTTLAVGGCRGGRWAERFRGERCRMEYTSSPLWPLGMAGRCADQRVAVTAEAGRGKALYVSRDDGQGRAVRVERLTFGARVRRSGFRVEAADDIRLLAAGERAVVAAASDATLRVLGSGGRVRASWRAGRPLVAGAVVADVDGDGLNEVLACCENRKVVALRRSSGDGAPEPVWRADGWGFPAPAANGPAVLAADVNGDGRKEVLTACATDRGGVGVQLLDSQGKPIWRTPIPGAVDTPLYETILRATFGDFTGDGRLDVYVSARMAMTGNDASHSFALDGRDGRILWHNDASDPIIWHHTMGPTGMPTVADVNGDGVDDILLVTLDLCTELNGKDGTFLHTPLIANAIWQQANQSTQWTAYGTQLPVDLNGDGQLEVLHCAAWGQWGAWTMDRRFLWTVDPGRDQHSARHPGIADVDGDGRLEIGAIHNGGFLRCYDAATGALKWEIAGVRPWSDVVTADVDGDGLPEFVAGLAAFKAVDQKSGRILWEVAVPAGARSPVVADLDGDGFGEILVACGDGKLRAYR